MTGACSVDGCATIASHRGWCTKHYQRWRAHGDPLKILTGRGLPLVERFMARVAVDGGCWLWTAGTNDGGYGRFAITHDKNVAPHRWSYEHFIGPIPDGLTIDHVAARGCTSRLCVNPDHLEAVTLAENLRRAPASPSTINAAKTHCPAGHPYDMTYRKGARGCRRCNVTKAQRSRARLS